MNYLPSVLAAAGKNYHWLIVICLLLGTACGKENLHMVPTDGIKPTESKARSSGELELVTPSPAQLDAIARDFRDNWTSIQCENATEEYGYFMWEQAALESEPEEETAFVISIPFVKDGKLTGMLYSVNNGEDDYYRFTKAEELLEDNATIISTYGYEFSLRIASSFSNHQYFYDQSIGDFQQTLQELLAETVASPRCAHWEEFCDWIFFGNDITNGYMDCYVVVTSLKDCWRPADNWTIIPYIPTDPDGTNGGGGSPGNESGNLSFTDKTRVSWESDTDCTANMAPMLEAYINDLQLLFPCEDRTASQIVGAIMNRLCSTVSDGTFLTMADLEKELERYAYVDVRTFASDPDKAWAAYLEAACSCHDGAEEDCAEQIRIAPYSCESFQFEDLGLFQMARMKGARLQFRNFVNNSEASCKFNIQLSAPVEALQLSTGQIRTIHPGLAANAAAAALNETNNMVTGFYGPQHLYSNARCPEYEGTFSNFFDSLFELNLVLQVANWYDLHPSDVVLEVDPEAQAGYSGNISVPETTRVPDYWPVFGYDPSNCMSN
ncbi:MAG: hypothetical protein AAFV95_22470 [Bacteroidota bacterium]